MLLLPFVGVVFLLLWIVRGVAGLVATVLLLAAALLGVLVLGGAWVLPASRAWADRSRPRFRTWLGRHL